MQERNKGFWFGAVAGFGAGFVVGTLLIFAVYDLWEKPRLPNGADGGVSNPVTETPRR